MILLPQRILEEGQSSVGESMSGVGLYFVASASWKADYFSSDLEKKDKETMFPNPRSEFIGMSFFFFFF